MNSMFETLEISETEMEEMLINSDFNNEGWFFKNVSEQVISQLYRIYREIILDGLMPLAAVSGICLDAFQNSSVFDVTNYAGIKESLIEVMNNFSLLLFPPQKDDCEVKCSAPQGIITSREIFFSDGSKNYISMTNSYLFNASKPIDLNLRLSTGIGLNKIHTNTWDKKSNKKFLPIRTGYGLYKFVNVIGVNKTAIYHNISINLDIKTLKSILINFILGEEKQLEPMHNVSDIFNTLYARASKYGKAINAIKELYYRELNNDNDYKAIRDEFYAEQQKALNLGRKLSKSNNVAISKLNKEFETFKDLFVQTNIEDTANYLSGIPKVSEASAMKIAELIHEFV